MDSEESEREEKDEREFGKHGLSQDQRYGYVEGGYNGHMT